MGVFRTWNRVPRSGGVAFEWQTPTVRFPGQRRCREQQIHSRSGKRYSSGDRLDTSDGRPGGCFCGLVVTMARGP
jgi:hypothetical protein